MTQSEPDKSAAKVVVQVLERHYGAGWKPSTRQERAAADIFHDLLHYSDGLITRPIMDKATEDTLDYFGGISSLHDLTPETVLEARKAFCAHLTALWAART